MTFSILVIVIQIKILLALLNKPISLSLTLPLEKLENFSSSNNEFGAFYINVKRSKLRNVKTLETFALFQPLVRIEAVTPSHIVPELRDMCGDATDLELACSLSHLKAIKTAYVSGVENALIIEDDVIIYRIPDMEKLIHTAPKNWEILQLLTLDYRTYYKKHVWVRHTDKQYTAAVYLINRQGMKKVLDRYINEDGTYNQMNLDQVKTLNCAADYLIYKGVNAYTCTDLFFGVQTQESTLHTIHLLDQKYCMERIKKMFDEYGYKLPDVTGTQPWH